MISAWLMKMDTDILLHNYQRIGAADTSKLCRGYIDFDKKKQQRLEQIRSNGEYKDPEEEARAYHQEWNQLPTEPPKLVEYISRIKSGTFDGFYIFWITLKANKKWLLGGHTSKTDSIEQFKQQYMRLSYMAGVKEYYTIDYSSQTKHGQIINFTMNPDGTANAAVWKKNPELPFKKYVKQIASEMKAPLRPAYQFLATRNRIMWEREICFQVKNVPNAKAQT